MTKLCRYLFVATAPVWAQPVSPTINTQPSREFGQPSLLPSGLNSVAPNLVEGRELNNPLALAFDTSVTPPILYIADTFNQRVLAYKNPPAISSCGLNNASCGFADLVIGQRDLTGTLPGGPGSPGLTVGFAFPTGLAVDSSGNLYVADNGNNRILRFPSPFKQAQNSSLITPDLVIGQSSLNNNQPNQGQNLPSAQTLSFSSSKLYVIGMAIEATTGSLWVSDPANNRVLRFPASQLSPNTNQPAADLVLGQNTFTAGSLPSPPPGQQGFLTKTLLNQPGGLAFDSTGRLYVTDNYARVLFFQGPFTSGMSASRILGILVQQNPPLSNVNQYALGSPIGLAALGNNLFVTDGTNNRVVEYDVPEKWPAEPNFQNLGPGQQISPPMIAVVGQGNLNSGSPNQAHAKPSATTLSGPAGIAFNGTDLWIAELSNNRVVAFPQQGGNYSTATRLIGQLDFVYSAANLIEGREMYFSGAQAAGGVAIDHTSNPPHLYIADTYNNRILCFNDARTVQSSSRADMVLGQGSPTNFYDNLINSGTNSATTPTQGGLNSPIGVVVATNGDLWVADSGNGRVLRYPAPFAQSSGSQPLPNLVLGQAGFNSLFTDVTNQTMHTPWGIVLLGNGSVAVSDAFHNRVLVFKKPATGDFTSGQLAAIVLGQPDFNTLNKSTSISGMNTPTHMAVDSSDRLYVCDTLNNRVLIFNNAGQSANGATSAFQLNNLSQPQGIAIPYPSGNPAYDTGEIWIANTAANAIYRLPSYETLILNATPNAYPVTAKIQPQTGPLALALDDSDNLIVGEQANRITFFFAQLSFGSLASYNNVAVAPGELAFLGRAGLDFSLKQVYNSGATTGAFAYPWPTSEPVNDIQIVVSAPGMTPTPAPIFRVDQTFISFQIPSTTPPSGAARFVLMHASTGEILGEGDFQMAPYAPAFWTANAQGFGQVAAFNNDTSCSPQPDCQINGPGKEISRDGTHTISFCLTGGGVFQGGPADGQPPTGQAPTAVAPQLISASFANGLVPPANITYSGAGCGFAGGWQINFLVPAAIPPSENNVIAVTLGGVPSTVGPNGTPLRVWFATK